MMRCKICGEYFEPKNAVDKICSVCFSELMFENSRSLIQKINVEREKDTDYETDD
jgi:uncharacterized OB-fold protein